MSESVTSVKQGNDKKLLGQLGAMKDGYCDCFEYAGIFITKDSAGHSPPLLGANPEGPEADVAAGSEPLNKPIMELAEWVEDMAAKHGDA